MGAMKVIASAWSGAFIVAFLLWCSSVQSKPDTLLTLFLLAGAITGGGWLSYRSAEKAKENDHAEG